MSKIHQAKDQIYRPKTFTLYTYNRYFNQFIDKYNWGINKKFRYTRDYINYCRNNRKSQKIKLTLDLIQHHLSGKHIIYYTCKRSSIIGYHTVDIDPADTSTIDDVLDCTLYIINTYHPGSYYEITPRGGAHIVLLVDYSEKFLTCPERNHFICSYSNSLFRLVQDMGYNVKFDSIKGTYSTDRRLSNRGTLCSLPRPNTTNAYYLFNNPILSLSNIRSNMCRIAELTGDTSADDFIRDLLDDHDSQGDRPGSLSYRSSINSNILGTHFEKCVHIETQKLQDPDANKRTIASIKRLSRLLGRLPDYPEWHEYYLRHGLNTGQETPKRKTRFEDCLEYVGKTFDPDKCRANYLVGDYIDDIRVRITEQELHQISHQTRYTRKITYEDLDVCMGYHWHCFIVNRDKYELTVPTKGLVKWFRGLKGRGLYNRSCNNSKIAAMRSALRRMGYITFIDKEDFKISQKWGIGENFPKYNEFVLLGGLDMVRKVTNGTRPTRILLVE